MVNESKPERLTEEKGLPPLKNDRPMPPVKPPMPPLKDKADK